MPIYEYNCEACGQSFEKIVFSDSETICCPSCGKKEPTKLMSSSCVIGGGCSPDAPSGFS